jgi:crotonobetainyl-CoA:carnitine CoA-transferase CaiB-like acyl-CoA transferase
MAEITSIGPLSSLRVLALGDFIAASFGMRRHRDLGTEIIKLESAEDDTMRDLGKQNGKPQKDEGFG